MVRTCTDNAWMQRGFSLLWGPDTLAKLVTPAQVVSIRDLFAMSEAWPDELPACNGNALVVSGLEGCLDILSPADAERWIENDLNDTILAFQEEYEGQAALVLWVPSGRSRLSMVAATEEYYWKHATSRGGRGLHLGRLLWAGAEKEVERLLESSGARADYDGKAWVGLHHPRIS